MKRKWKMSSKFIFILKTKKVSFKRGKADHCVSDWEHGYIPWEEELQQFWIFPGGCCQRWATAWKELEVIYSSDSGMKAAHPEEHPTLLLLCASVTCFFGFTLNLAVHIRFDKSSPKLRMPWCLWGCLARGCWIRRAPRTHHSGTHHSDSNPTCTGCSSSVVPLLCVWGLFPTLSVTQPFFPG